jgi:hypothetical protein
MKRLFERVDGIKESDRGGVPVANEMPLDKIVPAVDTELLVPGNSNGAKRLGKPLRPAVSSTRV